MIQMKCAKWKRRSFSLQIKNDQLPFCLSSCLCVCVAAVTWPWADLLCIVSYCSCDWRAEGGVLLCRLFAVFVFSTCTLHKRKQNDFNAIIHMKSHFETETVWCDFSQLFNCSSAGFFLHICDVYYLSFPLTGGQCQDPPLCGSRNCLSYWNAVCVPAVGADLPTGQDPGGVLRGPPPALHDPAGLCGLGAQYPPQP